MKRTLTWPVTVALLAAACSDDPYAVQEAEVAADDLSEQLTQKYGVRPRRYGGYFNASNEAELRFRAALAEATTFLETKVDVWTAELAVNFLAEGGLTLLDDNVVSDIDSYAAIGAD